MIVISRTNIADLTILNTGSLNMDLKLNYRVKSAPELYYCISNLYCLHYEPSESKICGVNSTFGLSLDT